MCVRARKMPRGSPLRPVGCPLAFFAAPASAPANRPKASCSDRQRSAASRAAAFLPLLAACRMLEQADAPAGESQSLLQTTALLALCVYKRLSYF